MQLRIDVIQSLPQLAPGGEDGAEADLGVRTLELQAIFDRRQNLADAKQADHRDQEVEAGEKMGRAEGQSQRAGHLVEADGGEREPARHRCHDLHG